MLSSKTYCHSYYELISCFRLDQEAAIILEEKEKMAKLAKLAEELELRFQAEREEQERQEEEDRIAVLAAEALLRVTVDPTSLILILRFIMCLFISSSAVNITLRQLLCLFFITNIRLLSTYPSS
jgi:hypothetical protein